MRKIMILFAVLSTICIVMNSSAQQLPLVYDKENTGANYPIPYLPTFSQLPYIQNLPDPFEWADGRGRISHFSDWEYRRAEIAAQIQNYEIGPKMPRPDSITASYANGTLTVIVKVNNQTLTLTSQVILPSGTGPFPAVIGMNSPSGSTPSTIFSSRNVAQIAFMHNQVATYGSPSTTDPYYKLYPNLNPTNTGQYSAWIWGVSRIIDGLELVQNSLPIDLKHIAVTGCSYAGKMALFAGAFDERVALTIAQESGGGGATSWRYTYANTTTSGSDQEEGIGNTDYNWFMDAMKQFAQGNVYYMPEDHHELMAMVAPRALYVTANPGFIHLSNPSCDVCSRACAQVYSALGISDRFNWSLVGGHNHCAVPDTQVTEIGKLVDKFLLGKDTVVANYTDSPYTIDLSPWITWTNPTLTSGNSFHGRASLVFPANLQKALDTSVTFRWNKTTDANQYSIQLATDAGFTNVIATDSTTDTVATVDGLIDGETYYWHIQGKDASGSIGPWSDVWSFSTYVSLPDVPELLTPAFLHPNQTDSTILRWKKAKNADQYNIQISRASDFTVNIFSGTVTDTFKIISRLSAGTKYYWRVQAGNVTGVSAWIDSSFTLSATSVNNVDLPTAYSLSQNYPNPFNPTAKIQFALPKESFTRIMMYDILGREVQTLLNKELKAGYYEVNVNASNLPSGIYFYRIQSGSFIQTKKMVLMK